MRATPRFLDVIAANERRFTTLVVDFMRECADVHDIRFHAPVIFGLRDDGMRGLYLADGHEMPRNTPLFTVPLKKCITAERLLASPHALPKSSPAELKPHVADEEFHHMLVPISMALNVCNHIAQLPNLNAAKVREEDLKPEVYKELLDLFTGDLMPWCRMIDDEDWNEEHVSNVYKKALDEFQKQNVADLTIRFNRTMADLHERMELDIPLEHTKRVTRVLLARMDQLPTYEELAKPPLVRRMQKLYRAVTKQRVPRAPTIVPMVDMLNHSNRPNVVLRVGVDNGIPAVRVHTIAPIRSGVEICRQYNFGMDRSNALFRYGFLPFELFSIPDLDPWKEQYAKGIHPNMGEQSPAEREKQEQTEREVKRLQGMFTSRNKAKKTPYTMPLSKE